MHEFFLHPVPLAVNCLFCYRPKEAKFSPQLYPHHSLRGKRETIPVSNHPPIP